VIVVIMIMIAIVMTAVLVFVSVAVFGVDHDLASHFVALFHDRHVRFGVHPAAARARGAARKPKPTDALFYSSHVASSSA
jgi:hypothetical protein